MALTFANFCMILIGFNLLQPFQVCIVGSLFIVRRFGGDPQKTSLYAGRNVQANLVAVFFSGLFTVALLTVPVDYFEHYFSIFAVWLTFAVNVFQFVVYAFSKDKKHIKFYFWSVALAGIGSSFVQCSTTKVFGDSVHFYSSALASTGIFVFFFHSILKAFFKTIKKNIDYWIPTCHIAFNVLLSLVSAVCWTIVVVPRIGDKAASALTGKGPTFREALSGASIHILFCFLGHFTNLFHCPHIVPYHLCPLEAGHTILIVSDALEFVVGSAIGAFVTKYTGGPWVGDKAWFHFLWFTAVPSVALWATFLYALHHPDSKFTKKLKSSVLVGGGLSCLFLACGQVVQNIAVANSFGNAFAAGSSGNQGATWAGHATSFTIFVALFGLCTGIVLGEAHLRLYVEHEKAAKAPQDWPTYGYSSGKAICYWTWATLKKAALAIPSLFALDVAALVQL